MLLGPLIKAKMTSELPRSVITQTKHSIINSNTLPTVGSNGALVLLPVAFLKIVEEILLLLVILLVMELLVDENISNIGSVTVVVKFPLNAI